MSRLSESKHPAYHLRPNKAVDRFVFVELLRALELLHPLKDHTYVGFGGPYLEDFRLLAQLFPEMHLISIEEDEETRKRQRFHKCSRKMRVLHSTFEDYLASEFPTNRPVIVWADYTDFNRRCLLEAADIARRAAPWSVYRITVRAETPLRPKLNLERLPDKMPRRKRADFEEIQAEYRDGMAVDDISYDCNWFTWDSFRDQQFPGLLARMIQAVLEGSACRSRPFVPLHAVKYSDGTIMLSLTGIFCLVKDHLNVRDHFRSHFTFCGKDDLKVDEIDVPSLTTKERLKLEQILPTSAGDGRATVKKLGYLIEGDASEDLSRRKMAHYEKYYRLYPYFGKVVP